MLCLWAPFSWTPLSLISWAGSHLRSHQLRPPSCNNPLVIINKGLHLSLPMAGLPPTAMFLPCLPTTLIAIARTDSLLRPTDKILTDISYLVLVTQVIQVLANLLLHLMSMPGPVSKLKTKMATETMLHPTIIRPTPKHTAFSFPKVHSFTFGL